MRLDEPASKLAGLRSYPAAALGRGEIECVKLTD